MGIRTIFRFSLEQWVRSLKKMVLMIGLFTFSFLLTGAVIYGNAYSRHSRQSCDRLLSQGLENTWMMDIVGIRGGDGDGEEQREAFLAWLADMEEVAFAASYGEMNNELEGEAAQIILARQKELLPWPESTTMFPEFSILQNMVRYVQMNVDGWDLCRLELAQGAPPREITLGENQVYVYLGAGYEDIPLGTTMDILAGRTGVVAGIFKKGQKWLVDSELRYYDGTNTDSCIDMDYRFMVLVPRGVLGQVPSPTWYFGVHPKEDIKAVSHKIKTYCEKNNMSVQMGNLEKSFDAREALHSRDMKLIEQMMILTLFSVVLIQVCVQMAEILTSQRRYGILYANGMSMGALFGTVVVKNLLNLLLGGVIALALGLCWAGRRDILMEMALAKTAAVGIAAFAAAHILPMMVMAGMKPARLMRGI